ncbi:unnamed protein product [Brassicogethes aeneus]|uniref:Rho guanine nucleotide exchange factor 26 n=1 Tax=Brassicogethes aeneus TaxID=1431903 RepID=A0A9P0B2X7_BRAAE|nr:unnamed protein product [Brassicogethes aeneus]
MQSDNHRQHHRRSVSSNSFKKRHKIGAHDGASPVAPPRSAPNTICMRRNVGDKVFVSSPTRVYFEFVDENSARSSHCSVSEQDECDKVDYKRRGEEIRSAKDLPKIRNRIFEESLESQEISFYIGLDSESDHHYETLYTNQNGDQTYCDDYDSFDSDSEYENSYSKGNLNDSGLDIGNSQLPEPPNGGQYVLTRLAQSAGKHMKKLRRNWSLTKNDISKSITWMTKRKSRTDLSNMDITLRDEDKSPMSSANTTVTSTADLRYSSVSENNNSTYQHVETNGESNEKGKNASKKGFLNKFRRSMSMSADSATELTSNLNKPKSTFYLTETINVDDIDTAEEANPDSGVSLSPLPNAKGRPLVRPQSPPPPVPPVRLSAEKKTEKRDRKSSWYAEAGLFRNESHKNSKKPNTFWYAEVGLYQQTQSTPSTSSAENSGSNTNKNLNYKTVEIINTDLVEKFKDEEYYNMRNEDTLKEDNDESKKDESGFYQFLHLQLQDEPLYQFYDAAVLESVCNDGVSDFDSDGYEEVGHKKNRPSAMELVSPKRNSFAYARTLWCEVPEVIQSSVLSTLSLHQKKLQEAKFEMLTSEASYLNSLTVLDDHFVFNLMQSDLIGDEEKAKLFGKIVDVRDCSEKLLQDLETCWQDNVLLPGICEIIQKHAEDNFDVYVSYCGNQIFIDETLKKLKDKPAFQEILVKLEMSSTCHSLTLYSFLMLPMQRITRWPLLLDAVLKRLSQQDPEYISCQYALATLNKIVIQCNEAARTTERVIEMKKIASQLEFAKGVRPIKVFESGRWLVRSGNVTHMQPRNDDSKLTFGKRFNKVPLNLFLFNDILFVCKTKNDNSYNVIQYCPRNLVEINSSDVISLPVKDSQGRHLIFLSLLENQDEKTVEFMLSCNSESDRERWMEALSPLKSENPDETLYECWDCPQVTAVHNYTASQPDELPVVRGDVINVLRKMADGWYHGERIRDGQTGWFPANYTVEIANPHVRARNLKQRYRLLAFSENYLKAK